MTFLRSLLLLLSQIDLFWPPPPPSSPIPHEKNSCQARETAAEEGGKGARERETGNASHLSPQKNRPSAKRTCTKFGTAASSLKTSGMEAQEKGGGGGTAAAAAGPSSVSTTSTDCSVAWAKGGGG